MQLDKEYYSLAEVVSMVGDKRGKGAYQNVLSDIKRKVLKASKGGYRNGFLVARRDVERYLRKLNIPVETILHISTTVTPPTPPEHVPSLQAVAAFALGKFLEQVPESDRQDAGMNLLIDAIGPTLQPEIAKAVERLRKVRMGSLKVKRYAEKRIA